MGVYKKAGHQKDTNKVAFANVAVVGVGGGQSGRSRGGRKGKEWRKLDGVGETEAP